MKEELVEYEYGIAQTFQSGVRSAISNHGRDSTKSAVVQVDKIYSDRMTCDVRNLAGSVLYNVPIMCKAGVINKEIYGELDLPAIGDYVVVDFIDGREARPVIVGTIIPYLHSYFQSAQVPVKTDNKAFTKKLLEVEKLNTYRRIFKTGTTVEVQEDGTVVVETPAGHYIKIPGIGNGITIQEKDGCSVVMSSSSVMINGNLEVLK